MDLCKALLAITATCSLSRNHEFKKTPKLYTISTQRSAIPAELEDNNSSDPGIKNSDIVLFAFCSSLQVMNQNQDKVAWLIKDRNV